MRNRHSVFLVLLTIPLLLPPICAWKRESSSSCPSTCASDPSNLLFIDQPVATVTYRTIQKCRKACFTNNYNYYSYSSATRHCSCFKSCQGTRQGTGSKTTVIGLASVCSDIVCPTTCASGISRRYITSPAPAYTVLTKTIAACQSTCASIGPFYLFTTAGTCSCYSDCTMVSLVPLSIPAAIGKVSRCAPLPPVQYNCSAFVAFRPRCGPHSIIINSTGLDLKPRYQCCCVPGTTPIIVGTKFVGCRRS